MPLYLKAYALAPRDHECVGRFLIFARWDVASQRELRFVLSNGVKSALAKEVKLGPNVVRLKNRQWIQLLGLNVHFEPLA
jgi:hypothetical protein